MIGVQVGDDGADPVTELWLHGRRPWIDQGDVQAHPTGHCGDLGTEETRTHHDHPRSAEQVSTQRQRIVEGPQQVHSGQLGTGQAARDHTGGHAVRASPAVPGPVE